MDTDNKSNSKLIWVVIVIIVIILGALYFWNNKSKEESTEGATLNTEQGASLGSSADLDALENDLNSTNLEVDTTNIQ